MVISSDVSTIFSILQCHILADLALVQTVLEVHDTSSESHRNSTEVVFLSELSYMYPSL
jgi:hypothetical protein